MRPESFAFAVTLLALLGTPILAPVAAWSLSKLPLHFQRRAFALLVGCTTLAAVALGLRVTTPVFELDVAFLAAAYLAAGVVLISAFRFRPSILGIVSGGVAVLLLSAGVFAGTAGAVVVLFIVGDSVPIYEEVIAPERKCYVRSFGNATTSVNGYEVVLKRQTPVVALFEFPIATMRFDDPKYDLLPAEACRRAINAKNR
jgi:hypothetical protein